MKILVLIATLAAPSLVVATDPSDPSSSVTPFKYESVFSTYDPTPDAPRLSWPDIFQANGEFASDPKKEMIPMADKNVVTTTTAAHSNHGSKSPDRHAGAIEQSATSLIVAKEGKAAIDPALSAPGNTAQERSSTQSDTRGRVLSIDTVGGKVKLKHGPIPKFDMPGMTMVFRVRDPQLLTQIKPDQETGVTFERIDGAVVITGFQK